MRCGDIHAPILRYSVRREGIGTLSEGGVHRSLKYYIEPDDSRHEIDVMGSVADIKNELGIFEIQTRSFENLVPKLEKFLRDHRVTVVVPLALEKTVSSVDRDSGTVSVTRKSPKHERPSGLCRELYKIKDFLLCENFSLRIISLDVSEYRETHKGRRGKIIDRVPNAVISDIELKTPDDYARIFLPDTLPQHFTAKDYSAAIGVNGRISHYGIKLMTYMGRAELSGKIKNAFVYKRAE